MDRELFDDAALEYELWYAEHNLPFRGKAVYEKSYSTGTYVHLYSEDEWLGRYDIHQETFEPAK